MTGPFQVLHICTGNIGRSPMAERLMRMRLDKAVGADVADAAFLVSSAGTWGHTGSRMEAFAVQALAARGSDSGGFTARELTEAHIRSADLVLTATAEHRAAVVGLVPAALHRTFTLRELARLAPGASALLPGPGDSAAELTERARQAVTAALVVRGQAPRPSDPADDDVVDPFGAPMDFYAARADEIDAACAEVVGLLTGVTG